MHKSDTYYMRAALKRASKAAAIDEVPVGAVIVKEGKIIAGGYNRREIGQNAILHAELCAIDKACKKIGSWRLNDCTLYVTLEPCPMCAGAIINARLNKVVIGAGDPKAGAFGSVIDLNDFPFNHKPIITFGTLEAECSEILTIFFKELRAKKAANHTSDQP